MVHELHHDGIHLHEFESKATKKKGNIQIPEIDLPYKNMVGKYFELLVKGSPVLTLTVEDKKNNKEYKRHLNVEVG